MFSNIREFFGLLGLKSGEVGGETPIDARPLGEPDRGDERPSLPDEPVFDCFGFLPGVFFMDFEGGISLGGVCGFECLTLRDLVKSSLSDLWDFRTSNVLSSFGFSWKFHNDTHYHT